MKKVLDYFSKTEIFLWSASVIIIILSFVAFDKENYLTLAASLIGVTSLIFSAKGNPIGMLLMVVFSILYGIISYSFAYYGEMITYIGMTGPMSLFSLISWLRNPYKGKKSVVSVNHITGKEIVFMAVLTVIVTIAFYFILKQLNTANLILSTISVTTSFAAVYLTFRRSAYYALAYAANDIILIVLWILAAMQNVSYIPVIICFVVFLINDFYGFISWQRMSEKQQKGY